MTSQLILTLIHQYIIMNRSELSNDFNFDNELDISNTRKDKTEHYFSKEGFQFQDFMNLGDRTINYGDRTNKSQKFESKIHQNTSKIIRDEPEQQMPSKILEQFSSYSVKRKYTKDELLSSNFSHKNNLANSPKFAEGTQTSKSIQMSPKKQQFTLRRAQERRSQKKESIKLPENPFKKKDNPAQALEEEYRSLESQIRFYEEEAERMLYESAKIEQETENLMISFNSSSHQAEVEHHAQEIKQINKCIEEQRQLEVQLTKMISQLTEQYDNIVNSIKTSRFSRPTVVRDEAKILIDEINSLKAELDGMERDDGSLNLSSTLINPPASSINLKNPGSSLHSHAKHHEQIAKKRISQIYEYNKTIEDPRYLFNLKMACLKTEWSLFTNSEIHVNVSYRDSPKITLRIGNKLSKDLQRFSLKQNEASILEGEVIAAKSYYVHSIEAKSSFINELFAKIEISYLILGNQKNMVIFVPLGMTNFGQFSPITRKQFQNDAGQAPFEGCGGFRPIDKKMVSSVQELIVYLPNLILSEDNQVCLGFFICPFEGCEFVIFRQRGQMLSITTKQPNWPLLRMLQFIFTV